MMKESKPTTRILRSILKNVPEPMESMEAWNWLTVMCCYKITKKDELLQDIILRKKMALQSNFFIFLS